MAEFNEEQFALAVALAKSSGGGGGGSSVIDDTTTASDKTWSSNKIKSEFDNLPNPMVFKGTLGSGGTIESLPTASDSNKGFVYIVITDGTYAGQSARAGDMFISNGTSWILVPSADEPTPIVISDILTAGSTQITFSNSAITADSLIDVYADVWYSNSVQSEGSVVLTFPVQASDMVVKIKVG